MNDGTFKACKGSDIGVNVKRVWIAVQSVKQCLIEESFVLDDDIRVSFGGRGDGGAFSIAFSTAASQASGKDAGIDIESGRLFSFFVDEISSFSAYQNCSLFGTLIDDVDHLGLHSVGGADFEAFVDHVKFFLAVENGVQFELGEVGIAEHANH